MKFSLAILLFLSAVCAPVTAQWKKIWYTPNGIVGSIYFIDSSSIGFLSVVVAPFKGEIWRTSDKGMSWQQAVINDNPVDFLIGSFTFKDEFEGWVSKINGHLFHTTDGGFTWSDTRMYWGHMVFYHPQKKYLLGNGASYIYSLDGKTVQGALVGTAYSTNGIAFSDSTQGFISPLGGGAGIYTTDGGLTWAEAVLPGEIWQPVGIKGTSMFFGISEFGKFAGTLYLSKDGGRNWTPTYKHTATSPALGIVTGAIQYDKDIRIYFQSINDTARIMASSDTGHSFYSICGPSGEIDTKFCIDDTFLFAGDRYGWLWLNTTGIGSNSTPILSNASINLQSTQCDNIDTTLTFTFFDSCNGRHARLLEASVSGSPSFSLSGASPRVIHADDSLGIHYQWSTNPYDTGKIKLRFKLGWKEFDTTVTLFGKAIQKENIVLQPSLTRSSAKAGDGTDLLIKPDKAAVNKNLSEIDFTLTYNSDVLDGISASTDIPGAAIRLDDTTMSGRYTIQPITISGANMSLDPAKAIARLSFRAMLSDSISSPLRISDVRLNKGDADYERCTLSATSDSAAFNLEFLCGDKILVDHLRGNKLNFSIVSLRPNPASNVLEVEVNSLLEMGTGTGGVPLRIEIVDATGNVVLSKEEKLVGGSNVFNIDISHFSNGSYILWLKAGATGDVVTEKFVKQK